MHDDDFHAVRVIDQAARPMALDAFHDEARKLIGGHAALRPRLALSPWPTIPPCNACRAASARKPEQFDATASIAAGKLSSSVT